MLTEQHFAAAKTVRKNAEFRHASERALFIQKPNTLVVCARLAAQHRGGISLHNFDWESLWPNWAEIERQIRLLAPYSTESPPLAQTSSQTSTVSWRTPPRTAYSRRSDSLSRATGSTSLRLEKQLVA